MKLGTRMVVVGAVLPALLLVGSFGAIGVLLDQELREQLDQALLTQAAIESVSLFDSPDGTPHLHLASSPLADRVRGFAATGALYNARGERVLQHPEGVPVPERLVPEPLVPERLVPERLVPERLVTERLVPERARLANEASEPALGNNEATDNRELTMTLVDGEGASYVLWLGLPLEGYRQTVSSYYQLAGVFSLVVLLILLPLSLGQSRQIAARLGRLATHMRTLREGNFDPPPPDASGDVLGELRASIAETTLQLGAASESQDRFIAEAAHELRTPLAALRATIDVSLRRQRSAEELRAVLETARREVDRLSALATSLLDLASARRGSIERSAVDLRALIEEAVDAARSAAEERDLLIGVEGAEQAEARVAEFQIRQAIDNLLVNAIHHAPRGSTIDVAIEAKGAGWSIVVQDHGPGVAHEERERIFGAFYRAPQRDSVEAVDPKAPGAGLGLALVREIATRHGGTVRVDDTDGGARFVLTLK